MAKKPFARTGTSVTIQIRPIRRTAAGQHLWQPALCFQLRENNELSRVRAMILLDLMGYKNLELGRDTMSTRWLQDIVWQHGQRDRATESIL